MAKSLGVTEHDIPLWGFVKLGQPLAVADDKRSNGGERFIIEWEEYRSPDSKSR